TGKFLKRPPVSAVSNTSGLAGIAHWINIHYKLKDENARDKKSDLVVKLKEWVDKEYAGGRVTVMTDTELVNKIDEVAKDLGIVVKEGEVVTL
ncbi:MAG: 2-isopropylmalate synthase, partial [Lachnospiraceae bacterium]|nr:2-isopropylmalate synthase [Lachnospiraceae bacterium]